MKNDYISINKKSWNAFVDEHYHSEFYNVRGFLKGKTSLNPIELDLLGDISGKEILHLQCHFGQDSISLARLGAKVTAVDFSEKAIEKGKELANFAKQRVDFLCSDVYALPQVLDKKFDIVFTSYGVIGWLPDLDKWAEIISYYLKPHGKFFLAEFHPVVWMFNDEFQKIQYNYFNTEDIIETTTGTYTNRKADIVSKTISWNHSLSEVLSALLNQNLEINQFKEFDHSPYDCFQGTEEFSQGKFRIKHLKNKIPMVYAIEATKTK